MFSLVITAFLSFAFGWFIRSILTVEPAMVVVRREAMPWIERDGVRERVDFTSEQQAELLDRLDAAHREIATLRGLLSDRRLDEVSAERRLRVVEG